MSTDLTLISKEKIAQFEQMLLQMPQTELPITHEFCNGLYARTMFIPAGVALTGATHKEENFLIVRCGEIYIWAETGQQRLTSGQMVKSSAGAKRVGYAVVDTFLTTFHANPLNETDPDILWRMYAVEDTPNLLEKQLSLNFEVEQ